MIWAFDDDQLMFRDALRELLAKECPPGVVRAAQGPELDRGLWDRLVEMGIPTLLVEERHGGLGLDERWLVLLLEECGYAAVPHPVCETAAVVMPMLADRLEHGTMATTDLGSVLVPCAADSDVIVLRTGDGVRVVDRQDCTVEPVATVDAARRAGRVTGDGAEHTDVDVELAFERGAWAVAAFLVGLAQRMLDDTVAYVTERHQFGVPVGSFQAIKHHLADVAKEILFARPAVHRAAWSLATRASTVARDVSMAKAMASNAAAVAGRTALQCHGAIGYTVEHDLQLYMKRAWALERAWGDVAFHRRRIAAAIGLEQ